MKTKAGLLVLSLLGLFVAWTFTQGQLGQAFFSLICPALVGLVFIYVVLTVLYFRTRNSAYRP